MDIRKTRTCERCKTVVPLEKVRLFPRDKDVNLVVCEPCCDELKTTITQKNPNIASRVQPLLPPEYSTIFCGRCDYTFRIDRNKAGITYNLKCPYCGKQDKLKHNL